MCIRDRAGVGEVISNMISSVVPKGNIVIGVIIYVFGMVIFTMIMGNAFAAFTVITAGIGVPFVIMPVSYTHLDVYKRQVPHQPFRYSS